MRIHVVQTEVDMSDMYMVIKVITGCDALHIHICIFIHKCVCCKALLNYVTQDVTKTEHRAKSNKLKQIINV